MRPPHAPAPGMRANTPAPPHRPPAATPRDRGSSGDPPDAAGGRCVDTAIVTDGDVPVEDTPEDRRAVVDGFTFMVGADLNATVIVPVGRGSDCAPHPTPGACGALREGAPHALSATWQAFSSGFAAVSLPQRLARPADLAFPGRGRQQHARAGCAARPWRTGADHPRCRRSRQ